MAAKNGFPSLAFLYETKNQLLAAILQQGAPAPLPEPLAAAAGISRKVSLEQALAAVEKMIEAMASLRDFDAEPFTRKEQKALDAMWLLESDREAQVVTL